MQLALKYAVGSKVRLALKHPSAEAPTVVMGFHAILSVMASSLSQ
jgi:hypothetical protein